MVHRILQGILSALLLATTASAQWRSNDEVVPDTAWRKSSGDFGAMLLITSDPDSFFEAWSRPSSADYKPAIKTSTKAYRGGTVVAVVVFRGCSPDKAGNCNSDMDLRLLYPDGSIYSEFKALEVWIDKPAVPKDLLQVSVANLGLLVEADDPLGTYRFEAVVRDKVAGKTLELAQIIDVIPAADQEVQAGYSKEPLRRAVLEPAEVAVHMAVFNNWLNERAASLNEDELKNARETLFYLIDSHVKHTYLKEGKLLPSEPDLLLAVLFGWGERLGVYGGSLVSNALSPDLRSQPPPTLSRRPDST